MRNEIPTQTRRIRDFAGTAICIILAASASALMLTVPVLSAKEDVAPAGRQLTPPSPPTSKDTLSAGN